MFFSYTCIIVMIIIIIIIMKFLMFRQIGIIKFEEIRKIIFFYFNNNIRINYQRVLEDNIEIYNLEQFDTKFWFSDE